MTERVNIRRLQMPEKEKNISDITDDDWSNIIAHLNKHIFPNGRIELGRGPALIADFKRISPERAKELPVIGNTDWRRIERKVRDMRKEMVKKLMTNARPYPLIEYLASIRAIEPSRCPTLDQNEWLAVTNEAWQRRNWGNWYDLAQLAFQVLLFDPQRGKEMVDEELHQHLVQEAADWRRKERYDASFFKMSYAKVFYPEKAPPLSDEEWKWARGQLQEARRESNWSAFLTMAIHMKILAATDVDVTENGLTFTMPQDADYSEKQLSRPDTVQFKK